MPLQTITLINQKGGCGKSSCCFHLSGALFNAGLRVLLIDADPQGSLSQAFFGPQYVEALNGSETVSSLFREDGLRWSPATLAKPTAWQGVSVVCSNQTLAPHNRPSPEEGGLLQFALSQYLESVEGFDVVLIDCPPNLYQCTWNALIAADFVVVPVPPEDFGVQGLRAVHQAIENAHQLNPRLRLLGHLISRCDRRLLVHQSYEAKLRDLYGPAVFQTVIPEASAFKVALACRTPVPLHAPASRAADSTLRLAGEILDRASRMGIQDDGVCRGQYA